jgi:hypothetical protein
MKPIESSVREARVDIRFRSNFRMKEVSPAELQVLLKLISSLNVDEIFGSELKQVPHYRAVAPNGP